MKFILFLVSGFSVWYNLVCVSEQMLSNIYSILYINTFIIFFLISKIKRGSKSNFKIKETKRDLNKGPLFICWE